MKTKKALDLTVAHTSSMWSVKRMVKLAEVNKRNNNNVQGEYYSFCASRFLWCQLLNQASLYNATKLFRVISAVINKEEGGRVQGWNKWRFSSFYCHQSISKNAWLWQKNSLFSLGQYMTPITSPISPLIKWRCFGTSTNQLQ